MGELIDKTKGKAKEIAGVVTGNRELESEGKTDQAKGAVKEGFENLKQGVKDAINPNRKPNTP